MIKGSTIGFIFGGAFLCELNMLHRNNPESLSVLRIENPPIWWYNRITKGPQAHNEGERKMKKTNKMAVIGQLNRMTGNYTHIERRVFEDEAGNKYVRINGDYTDIDWLIMHDRRVHIYF